MALHTGNVTVGTTPTLLSSSPRRGLDDVHWVEVIVPAAGSTVYVGGSDVTSSNGRPVAPSSSVEASWAATLGPEDHLYGVTASGTQAVRVLRSREPV